MAQRALRMWVEIAHEGVVFLSCRELSHLGISVLTSSGGFRFAHFTSLRFSMLSSWNLKNVTQIINFVIVLDNLAV